MSSAMQSPSESVLLVILGESMMSAVVEACAFTLIYGVFILLFTQATVTYLKRKQKSWAQHLMFLASATTFVIAAMFGAAKLVNAGIFIHTGLVGYPGLSLADKRPLINGQLIKPNLILHWTSIFELIISDGVVVWRVIILLQHRKWLKGLPLVLLLASSASYFAFMICISASADSATSSLAIKFMTAGDTLSLATNVVATSLIGWVYWLHRKNMVAGLGKHQPTQVERILILLVESGIVFFLFQITSYILGFEFESAHASTAGNYATEVFDIAYIGFAAIYPTMVIALVNNHCTIDDMYSQNSSLPTISHAPIQFAQLDPTTSAETLSQQVEKSQDVEGV